MHELRQSVAQTRKVGARTYSRLAILLAQEAVRSTAVVRPLSAEA